MGVLTAALVIASAVFSYPVLAAHGSALCGDRASLVAELAERYAEKRAAMGMTGKGMMLEILASPDGATWSLIITDPNGVACIVEAGEGWQTPQPVEKIGHPV